MHILSEKPLADSWADCVAISKAVRASGVLMMVTQNYRYTPRMLTLKKAVRSLGAVNYAVARYAADYRKPLSWGAPFRHEMRHALLIEASIHHFDQLRNLTGANWLDGGPETATVLADNLQSNALMFCAMEASETGAVIDVQKKAAEAAAYDG